MNTKTIASGIIIVALALGIPAYAQSLRPAANGVNDSTYVGYGQTATITAADGSCEIIHNQNPTGNTIFVPGKYIEEWDWFSPNLQQGVTVSACPSHTPPPPPAGDGGTPPICTGDGNDACSHGSGDSGDAGATAGDSGDSGEGGQ